ncbi:MAG TPA: hypothetical protein VD968_18850 [Pyrinomonadaceae bacterium]|nr:hypothetical protein [Pyrinomonadaceae bacterium]
MKDGREQTPKAFYRALAAFALALGFAQAASAQVTSTSYRGTARDPFVKYRPPVPRKVEKKVNGPIQPPPIRARIENYKAQKLAAMNLQQPAPKPTTALLLSEVQVTGIFRTPRGYAAMVEATPIKLSYVVYPGEAFYDGMLVAIEETRLVFRKQTRWTDGRVEVSVDTKSLRQPNAYADSLTTQRGMASGVAAEAGANSPDALVATFRDAHSSRDLDAVTKLFNLDGADDDTKRVVNGLVMYLSGMKLADVQFVTPSRNVSHDYTIRGVKYKFDTPSVGDFVITVEAENQAKIPLVLPVGLKDGKYFLSTGRPEQK